MDVIVIESDTRFLNLLRGEFPGEPRLHLADPAHAKESGLALLRGHPGSCVFLGATDALGGAWDSLVNEHRLAKPQQVRLIGGLESSPQLAELAVGSLFVDLGEAYDTIRAALATESPSE